MISFQQLPQHLPEERRTRLIASRINVADAAKVIRLLVRNGINPVRVRVWIMGLAFNENCPALHNTRVVDSIAVRKFVRTPY